MAEIKSRAAITVEGERAAEAGQPVTSNPYPVGTDAHQLWRKAWSDHYANVHSIA